MLVDFGGIGEATVPGMNGGTGTMTAKVFAGDGIKVIPCSLHPGCSIGPHRHDSGDDINYVLSGIGRAVCDGCEEELAAGTCHICRKGSEHSIANTGEDDLMLITVVVER